MLENIIPALTVHPLQLASSGLFPYIAGPSNADPADNLVYFIGSCFTLAMVLPGYALPTIIAALCWHRNLVSLTIVNLLLGWTVIGWVVALAWAFGHLRFHPNAAEARVPFHGGSGDPTPAERLAPASLARSLQDAS